MEILILLLESDIDIFAWHGAYDDWYIFSEKQVNGLGVLLKMIAQPRLISLVKSSYFNGH